jgi:hypothetical protein
MTLSLPVRWHERCSVEAGSGRGFTAEVERSEEVMAALAANLDLLKLGQEVRTAIGLGVVAAVSKIDSLVYVTFSNCRGLYIFRPEQIERPESSNNPEQP